MMENLANKSASQIEDRLKKYYQQAYQKILGQISSIYIELFSNRDEGFVPQLSDLYRLDRYWQLQGELRKELQKLGELEEQLLSSRLVDVFMSYHDDLVIPGHHPAMIDRAVAQQLVNQVWCADGLSWSQRVWGSTDKLLEVLNEGLSNCVILGNKTDELTKMIQEQFNVSYNQASCLVRTEIAHIQTQAAKTRYQEAGIKEMEVWASEDERRCSVCGKLHKKRLPIGAVAPVPAHPFVDAPLFLLQMQGIMVLNK